MYFKQNQISILRNGYIDLKTLSTCGAWQVPRSCYSLSLWERIHKRLPHIGYLNINIIREYLHPFFIKSDGKITATDLEQKPIEELLGWDSIPSNINDFWLKIYYELVEAKKEYDRWRLDILDSLSATDNLYRKTLQWFNYALDRIESDGTSNSAKSFTPQYEHQLLTSKIRQLFRKYPAWGPSFLEGCSCTENIIAAAFRTKEVFKGKDIA
jgi:hypothetical protein